MINAKLIDHIFKAASISRWNDYPKMVNLVELDKQAHKFIIAYFIAKLEPEIDMNYIIEGCVFEFLSRVVVTDIRPDVFHQIQKSKNKEIQSWILGKLENMVEDIDDGNFFERFKAYQDDKTHKKERLILKAASYIATKWEFSIVYQTSKFLSDIEELKQKVDEELEDYYELIGVRKIAMNQKLARIIDLSGRLRFQKRWAQTQRIPETAVLGHMLVVAIFAYFYSLKVGACPKRLENNFYCALFHDLPESLTRDIISPVKYGISGLNEIISEYEMRLIDERILPFVPESFRDEFSYILGVRKEDGVFKKDEFENRIKKTIPVHFEGSMSSVNDNEFNAIDGKALKYCDNLAAYVEAGISISYGVKSKDLVSGFSNIQAKFDKNPKIESVDFSKICDEIIEYFDIKL
ncbi:HD domain-containing protein [Campylobacter hyointestinalis]|uniref:HD domain-containing protein n=1 Tax=Campylobacter hyointestinalis TaxID=198 RepID=UPI000DCC620C|nr:HD domain-containing protein [Campylobacter hyointestinalis]RAZ24520.1 hydrolase [Campylobacter hyointestinalis subsp. lawsonii]RAZ39142.1 hydrolase [Campylobacter hyointestinalis subsp. lawsonii]